MEFYIQLERDEEIFTLCLGTMLYNRVVSAIFPLTDQASMYRTSAA